MWQFKKDTVVKWYYYDGDEFNDASIDRDKWHTAFSWTEINYDMKFRMTPERLVLQDGICKFMCYRDTGLYQVPDWHLDSAFKKKYAAELVNGNRFPYYFTAGDVWSKGKYERGYFELRFKNTNAYGMYPGFWLFGDNGDEIDFFELKGEREKEIHVDVHCKNQCDRNYKGFGLFRRNFGEWVRVTAPLCDSYNVLAGEWGDSYVHWYLNGEGIASFKGQFGSQYMDLILGTGVAQDGKPFEPGIRARTVFPNSLDVDYVRVWYKEPKPKGAIKGKQHDTFDYCKDSAAQPAILKRKIRYLYDSETFDADLATVSLLPKKQHKVVVSILGRSKGYQIEFRDAGNRLLNSATVTDSFAEFDFAQHSNLQEVSYTLRVADKRVQGKLRLVQ